MFEVAEVYLMQVTKFLPSLIGLYVLFDFLGAFIPGTGKWRD